MKDGSEGASCDPRPPGRNSAWMGAFSIAVLFAGLCAFSWEKWADPVVDFGNEVQISIAIGVRELQTVDPVVVQGHPVLHLIELPTSLLNELLRGRRHGQGD